MNDESVLNLHALRAGLPQDRARYAGAHPFPHIVLDDVLEPEAFALAAKEFPGITDEFWKGYIHVNEGCRSCNPMPRSSCDH